MITVSEAHRITDVETLEKLCGVPFGAAVEKEINHLHPHYQRLIAAAPFFVAVAGACKKGKIAARRLESCRGLV